MVNVHGAAPRSIHHERMIKMVPIPIPQHLLERLKSVAREKYGHLALSEVFEDGAKTLYVVLAEEEEEQLEEAQ